MSEAEFRQLFALFNSDSQHGVAKHGRFSPAFIGSTANQLVRDLGALNRWTARIWLASEEDELAFSAAATELLERYDMAPEELDYLLAAASREAASGVEPEQEPERAWIF